MNMCMNVMTSFLVGVFVKWHCQKGGLLSIVMLCYIIIFYCFAPYVFKSFLFRCTVFIIFCQIA